MWLGLCGWCSEVCVMIFWGCCGVQGVVGVLFEVC